MELDYKAIGKRVKIARIQADLTQERLAERIGISPTHLSNIETGTTRVSLSTIIRIANALSVTGDDLLCDNIIMAKAPFEKDIAALLADCDEYEIRVVKDMVSALKDSLRRDSKLRQSVIRKIFLSETGTENLETTRKNGKKFLIKSSRWRYAAHSPTNCRAENF